MKRWVGGVASSILPWTADGGQLWRMFQGSSMARTGSSLLPRFAQIDGGWDGDLCGLVRKVIQMKSTNSGKKVSEGEVGDDHACAESADEVEGDTEHDKKKPIE